MFTSMSVGANVEGMFDEGEEEQSIASFLESYANARMNDFGEPERLEGELVVLPDALPEWQEDVASLYRVSFDGDVPEAAVQEETNVPLDSYRCQTLLSAWAGSGLYTLHDGGAES